MNSTHDFESIKGENRELRNKLGSATFAATGFRELADQLRARCAELERERDELNSLLSSSQQFREVANAECAELREKLHKAIECEAVCHCGELMSRHNGYEGHSATAMKEPCPYAEDATTFKRERDEFGKKLAIFERVWADPIALHANLLRSQLCPEMRAMFLHLAAASDYDSLANDMAILREAWAVLRAQECLALLNGGARCERLSI